MTRDETLARASQAVNNRQAYGSPEDNAGLISARWTLTLQQIGVLPAGASIPRWAVALMLDDIKTSRLIATPEHEDSWVDKAGYAAYGAEVATAARKGGAS